MVATSGRESLRQPQHIGIDVLFLFQTLVLQFQIEVARSKDFSKRLGFGFCTVIVVLHKTVLDFPGQTGRQADEPVAVHPQHVLVDTRFIVISFGESKGYDFNQVLISLLVFRKQHKMTLVLVLIGFLIQHSALGRIDLTADNRLDTLFLAFFIKINHTEHDAVVCDSHAVHAQLLHPAHQFLDPGCTVQQTVFGMYMQMCKRHRSFLLNLNIVPQFRNSEKEKPFSF